MCNPARDRVELSFAWWFPSGGGGAQPESDGRWRGTVLLSFDEPRDFCLILSPLSNEDTIVGPYRVHADLLFVTEDPFGTSLSVNGRVVARFIDMMPRGWWLEP